MTMQNNDKKKYLTEIFAISRFKPTDTKEFSIEDPDIPIKVTIKNFYEYLPMLNKEKHYLICHCLTESESFEEARDKSELYLTEYLNYLSLITNQKSYILRTSRTIEWEKGLHERKVRMWIPLNLIFGRISLDINDNFPKKELNQISNGFNFCNDIKEKREKLLSLFCIFNEIKQMQDEYAVSAKLLTAFENYEQLVSNEVYINDIHHKCNASYCCSKCGELKLKPSVFKKEIVSLLTQVFEKSEANQIYGNLTV